MAHLSLFGGRNSALLTGRVGRPGRKRAKTLEWDQIPLDDCPVGTGVPSRVPGPATAPKTADTGSLGYLGSSMAPERSASFPEAPQPRQRRAPSGSTRTDPISAPVDRASTSRASAPKSGLARSTSAKSGAAIEDDFEEIVERGIGMSDDAVRGFLL